MTVSRGARRNAIALSIFLASTAIAADVVTDANAKAGDFIAAAKLAHNGANYRSAAIVQVAVFEAVNAVTGRFPNARLKLDPAPSASIDAAVLSATRSALVALTPSQQAQVEAWYAEALAAVLESPAQAAGVALGGKAAAGGLAFCAGGGSNRPDTVVAVMDAKYTYKFWRPITGIRNADRTQIRATEGNPGWLPFIDTPPHPEYPCAHCIVASAAATVLEAAMGDAPAKLSGTSAT